MQDINLFINWIFNSFSYIFNFLVNQHPIVQAVVFMPLGMLIINLFYHLFKVLFNGRRV